MREHTVFAPQWSNRMLTHGGSANLARPARRRFVNGYIRLIKSFSAVNSVPAALLCPAGSDGVWHSRVKIV
jgi:hypothetical protein